MLIEHPLAVAVRVRPALPRDPRGPLAIDICDDDRQRVHVAGSSFDVDAAFGPAVSQQQLLAERSVSPLAAGDGAVVAGPVLAGEAAPAGRMPSSRGVIGSDRAAWTLWTDGRLVEHYLELGGRPRGDKSLWEQSI